LIADQFEEAAINDWTIEEADPFFEERDLVHGEVIFSEFSGEQLDADLEGLELLFCVGGCCSLWPLSEFSITKRNVKGPLSGTSIGSPLNVLITWSILSFIVPRLGVIYPHKGARNLTDHGRKKPG